MTTTPFFQVQLRTTDPEAARAFYAQVLEATAPLQIFPLHDQAIARGARSHWVGSLEVSNLDAALTTFGALGATPLGAPTLTAAKWVNPEGLEGAIIRDPGGAVVGLVKPSPASAASVARFGPDLVSCLLNTPDVERAKRSYAELVGWRCAKPVDLGELGVLHPFSLEPGGAPVGAMMDIAGRPGVHPHWLFHFRVADLDRSVAAVRSLGGFVADLLSLQGGDRIAVCDDAQGAAFTLRQVSDS